MKSRQIRCATSFVLGLLVLAPLASGRVIGRLKITSDPGEVQVTATSIDWTPPDGPPDGRFTVGQGTTLTYLGDISLTVGSEGTILDLDAGTTIFPVPGFMRFDDAPSVFFDLNSLGPGPANTTCSTTLDPNEPACAVSAFSPFILTPTATGTAVTISARGNARDGTGTGFAWTGAFTTQIAGRTPAQIQANILGGGTETSTHSAEFAIFIPEPSTVFLLVVGVGLIAGRRWLGGFN